MIFLKILEGKSEKMSWLFNVLEKQSSGNGEA